MDKRTLSLNLVLWVSAAAANAAGGLVAPAAETLWPQWQARVALQTAGLSPLSMSRAFDNDGATHRGATGHVQGGGVFGDYYFASPSYGNFRASGGLLVGTLGGLPISSANAGPRLGLSLNSGVVVPATGAGADGATTLPYLGLGFSGAPWRNALSISADLGLVAEHSRALFGNQGSDGTVRELRLSPVLQLGLRYTF